MKDHKLDLLSGPILASLTKLALPITATAFVQMAYNLVDMLWIGRLGTGALAAVGAGGMFLWFSEGFLTLARMGGQVFTSHQLGAGHLKLARYYAAAALELAMGLGLAYSSLMISFRGPLVGLFQFSNPLTVEAAKTYVLITGIGLNFAFCANMMTALSIAVGNSRLPFRVNVAGLVLNIILDPVLIFILDLGVTGAALATCLSQLLVMLSMGVAFSRSKYFAKLPFHRDTDRLAEYTTIMKFSFPAAIQSMGFASIAMVISRIVASFGEGAFAAQKVGTQIESISWMTADGLANALRTFISQNYGAGNLKRAISGFKVTRGMMLTLGMVNCGLLFFLAGPIFSLFSSEETMLVAGIDYLRILALSQAFMCLEITVAAAYNGFGKSSVPATISLVFTLARIPLALVLIDFGLGVNGVWWAISLSSVAKGLVLSYFFHRFRVNHLEQAELASCN